MDRTTAPARAYRAPRLKVYGSMAELTQSRDVPTTKNDPVQGQLNLKT